MSHTASPKHNNMKIIVGLGNPGGKYAKNRHNSGFIVLDHYVKEPWTFEPRANALVAKVGEHLFVKPQTFMNNSGESVSTIVNFYKIPPNNLIVVRDDADMAFGKTRFRKGATSGGHKGIDDIISKLGTNAFWQFKVGVGRPGDDKIALDEWVLTDFSDEEYTGLTRFDPFFKHQNNNVANRIFETLIQ